MAAHAFAEQLLPAVAVFRHGRIRIEFAQGSHGGARLSFRGVNAGRRGEEVALHAGPPGRHQHVRVDQHGQHAEGLVQFDEPHPAHVGREVVYLRCALARAGARGLLTEIEREIFDVRESLIPVVCRLEVHGAKTAMALPAKMRDQVTADEASGAGDDNKIGLAHVRVQSFIPGRCGHRQRRDRDARDRQRDRSPPARGGASNRRPSAAGRARTRLPESPGTRARAS